MGLLLASVRLGHAAERAELVRLHPGLAHQPVRLMHLGHVRHQRDLQDWEGALCAHPGRIPAGEDPNNQEQCNVLDVRKCEVPLVVSVVGMEHINVENVAITVPRALFSDYSQDTGQMPGTHLVNFTS